MEPITLQQEHAIDINHGLILKNTNEEDFRVDIRDIYLYGHINLNNISDINAIINKNLVDNRVLENCNRLPSNFNYEKGTITPISEIYKEAPTYDPLAWFKYNHCLIGKPERVIVYRTTKSNL
jgi:hypothetical protein